MGGYDFFEIDEWESLFGFLNPQVKSPIKPIKYYSIFGYVERKQHEIFLRQIKDQLIEKQNNTQKLDLLNMLKMSEKYNREETVINWINDTIDLLKAGRYEDPTTEIKDNLDLTERLILLNLFVDEGLFPDLFNPSDRTVAEDKVRLFFSKLFNKPESSFKNSIEKANNEDDKLTNRQIGPRITNFKNIRSMLLNIEDVEGINVIIEKIEGRINKLKNK